MSGVDRLGLTCHRELHSESCFPQHILGRAGVNAVLRLRPLPSVDVEAPTVYDKNIEGHSFAQGFVPACAAELKAGSPADAESRPYFNTNSPVFPALDAESGIAYPELPLAARCIEGKGGAEGSCTEKYK